MKAIIIKSEKNKTYCKSLIDEAPIDGSVTVEIKKTPTDATYKQQKLWFKWCGEVSRSGLGGNDNTSDVHIEAKWRFVRTILIEENDIFGIIYDHFMKTIKGSVTESEYCKKFANKWIHTNDLTRHGRIRSLTDFQRYWILKGVNLTDPAMRGVDLTMVDNNGR